MNLKIKFLIRNKSQKCEIKVEKIVKNPETHNFFECNRFVLECVDFL